MAYAKREYSTNQPQTNQGKPPHVQKPFWKNSRVGYLVCLPLVGLALLGSLLEEQLGLHTYYSSAPLLLASRAHFTALGDWSVTPGHPGQYARPRLYVCITLWQL